MATTFTMRVFRGGPEAGDFKEYRVEGGEGMVVLDVIHRIQATQAQDLACRWNCKAGKCGSCSAEINGKPRLMCMTRMDTFKEGEPISVAPIRTFPIIRDLVTDMREFFDKWARAQGQFKGARTKADDFERVVPESPERKAVDAGIECIGCAVCYSACHVVAANPAYLGPAALNRAWTLVKDTRETKNPERLRAVAGDAGCHACHTHMDCTERCPKRLSPTAAIAGLKRATARAALKGDL